MNNINIDDIKFNDWEVIAISTNFDYLSMREMATVFIRSGEYNFYLYDESEKIIDVAKMPSYIYQDWIVYNKKELNIKVLDKNIKDFLDIGTIDSEFIANELKSIKRDLILKKII